jgi:hypothetical protein
MHAAEDQKPQCPEVGADECVWGANLWNLAIAATTLYQFTF